MTASTAFGTAGAEVTGKDLYYGSFASSWSLKITRGNCLVDITSVPDTYGDITINYTLTNDRETTCSIKPYYSTDGGTTFTEASKSTVATTGDAKTGLSTSAAGTAHTFEWDSYDDTHIDYVGDVLFKIRAYDGDNYIGDYTESYEYNIHVNNAPSVTTLSSPTNSYFQKDNTPTFQFVIPSNNNPEFVYSRLHTKIEVDTTEDFNSENLVTFESRLDQTGWEYKDYNDSWAAIPADGIQTRPEILGNAVRFVVPTDQKLNRTTLYWRVSFGGDKNHNGTTFHDVALLENVTLIGV